MKTFFAPLAALVFTAAATFATPAVAPNREYILLSGGPSILVWEQWKSQPHDLWWQNFIRAAEIRITELESQGVPASQITWFVYQPAYQTRSKQEGQNLVGNISALGSSLHVKLKFFSRSQQVIDYLNAGQPRSVVKIADLEYFGHSNKACWMFDYSNLIDSASKVWIHEGELNQLAPGIFARDAFIKSWGCHTGESMSQKFRRATGMKMWGATGRSQYMTHELPVLAQPEKSRWRY
ncbi:MAG: hypothetical protein NTZ46_08535 [Verrucomicrobia bacterium]|nr:hypothetical protein [Verrucomicrobiota bacterium]